jgi:hypothetical protein
MKKFLAVQNVGDHQQFFNSLQVVPDELSWLGFLVGQKESLTAARLHNPRVQF